MPCSRSRSPALTTWLLACTVAASARMPDKRDDRASRTDLAGPKRAPLRHPRRPRTAGQSKAAWESARTGAQAAGVVERDPRQKLGAVRRPVGRLLQLDRDLIETSQVEQRQRTTKVDF